MKKIYKISEVAKIFNISRQTLIHYHRIGLFVPLYVDEENSYRYYSGDQFFNLEFILLLKRSGFTLKAIKEYIKTSTPEESLSFLEEKQKEIDTKIKNLKKSREVIGKKIHELKKMDSLPDEPVLLEDVTFRVYMEPLPEEFNYGDFSSTFSSIEKQKKDNDIDGDRFVELLDLIGSPENNLGDYNCLTSLGFLIPKGHPLVPGESILSSPLYVHSAHRGSWSEIKNTYRAILDYIDSREYRVAGPAVEVFSNVVVHLGKGGEGTTIFIYVPVVKESF